MSNAIISIAARMTSTRLPGKTLARVWAGWALLDAICERLAPARAETLIATTDGVEDRPLVDLAHVRGLAFVDESPDDLMERHARAADEAAADFILLAGADDPFLDHRLFDMVLDRLEQGDVAYVKTEGWPLGMNVWGWTRQAMEEGNELATAADEREHVVPYWERRPSRYPMAVIRRQGTSEWVTEDLYDKYRLTIDNQSDLDLARAIYGILGRIDASAEEVIAVLQKYPSLAEMNRDGLHGTAARDAIYSIAPVDGSHSWRQARGSTYVGQPEFDIPGLEECVCGALRRDGMVVPNTGKGHAISSDVVAKVRRHIATERLAAKASVGERGEFAVGQDMALLSVEQWLERAF